MFYYYLLYFSQCIASSAKKGFLYLLHSIYMYIKGESTRLMDSPCESVFVSRLYSSASTSLRSDGLPIFFVFALDPNEKKIDETGDGGISGRAPERGGRRYMMQIICDM
eukprot:GEMP01095651.1.p1 GENE.GEMP01095651.1~~GEMP01095651.1.p1  ORF type:complete len:109 (+),score=8.37 GEMP01095651.1:467-793(+)